MRRQACHVATAATWLALMLAAPPGRAELPDCPSIGRGLDYKVVLGDVTVAAGAGADVATIRQRLSSKLKTSQEALRLENERRKVATAECPGRQPRDETEFDPGTVDGLNGLNVVLEIWGSVAPSPVGAHRQEAHINFALISLMKFEPRVDAIVDVTFPRGDAAGDALSELLLADPTELRAVTALAVALRLHKAGRYDAAKRAYCEAHTHLSRVALAGAAAWTALRNFALAGAGKVITEAQAQPDAVYLGGLKALPPTQDACSAPTP